MESYKCRFCFKSFVNRRALGGHMRSHMPSLQEEEVERASQLSDETESHVSSSEGEERKRNKFLREKFAYKTEPECEPLQSSASDTTTDEDLALCLMMLSRDKWKKNKARSKEVVEESDTEASQRYNKSSKKGRYSCETCGKVFKSYQALGGHRASHKKNRVSNKTEQTEHDNVVVVAAAEKRIHECSICLRVFASGQALGGHKRSHGTGNLSLNHHHQVQTESVKQRMIDLNLPAPTEEDEVSVVFQ